MENKREKEIATVREAGRMDLEKNKKSGRKLAIVGHNDYKIWKTCD